MVERKRSIKKKMEKLRVEVTAEPAPAARGRTWLAAEQARLPIRDAAVTADLGVSTHSAALGLPSPAAAALSLFLCCRRISGNHH